MPKQLYYTQAIPIYKPIEIQNTSKHHIEVENFTYQYKGYSKRSKGFQQFEFEKFTESRDSLFFYDLDDVKSKNGKHLDSLKIKKRMVEIQNSNNGSDVVLIVIENFEVDDNNKEIISHKTFHLRPKKQIAIDEFFDFGIFKPARWKSTPNIR